MPELPEVETVCRGLAASLAGRRIVRVEARRRDLRWPLPARFAGRLAGHRVASVGRRGKYILIRLDHGLVWMVHLGMSGRFIIAPGAGARAPDGAHEHVVAWLDDGAALRFHDQRRFGMMDLVPEGELAGHRLIAELGPEPLGDGFTDAVLAAALKGRRGSIKAALVDQRVVAGLGNIYACEILFRAGLSPRRRASTVTGRRVRRLVAAIRQVLDEAIAAGGSSLKDYVQASGELGYFQHRFAVYDREGEPCPGCDCCQGIRRIAQSGRSTFYCAKRQR
ncbi:MAG: bifunctional DNA-formamidopyrimidine glycosylase/DNA-(apurinic or apyrimidinic site) lyase [Kiloniellales bacterium]